MEKWDKIYGALNNNNRILDSFYDQEKFRENFRIYEKDVSYVSNIDSSFVNWLDIRDTAMGLRVNEDIALSLGGVVTNLVQPIISYRENILDIKDFATTLSSITEGMKSSISWEIPSDAIYTIKSPYFSNRITGDFSTLSNLDKIIESFGKRLESFEYVEEVDDEPKGKQVNFYVEFATRLLQQLIGVYNTLDTNKAWEVIGRIGIIIGIITPFIDNSPDIYINNDVEELEIKTNTENDRIDIYIDKKHDENINMIDEEYDSIQENTNKWFSGGERT